MKYRGIIFDLDGVICSTDEYHYRAWKTLADREKIYFDREINNRLRGVSRMASLEIILERAAHRYTQQEKEKMAELYALMNVYATAGHAQDLKADVEGNKEYQLWQEYDRTDIYAMYLEEIMEDAVCDYNVFSRGQE